LTVETCDECGFDGQRWRRRDAATLLGALGTWWRLAVDGIAADDLNRRPNDGVWSALEYGAHVALVTAMLRAGIEAITARDGIELPAPPPDEGPGPRVVLDPSAVLADIEREGTALVEFASRVDPPAWEHTATAGGEQYQAGALLVHAAHDASHHMLDVARGLAAIGAGTPHTGGAVVALHTSGGGVPKLPIDAARVERDGIVGDRQADAKHHGRPFQALCLWSREVISGLAADGHPINAGAAGENVTTSGIDWTSLRPGSLMRIGTVLAEVSFPATPCAKQTGWFSDGDFGRIDHDRNPGLTRWYAWVREPGDIRPGDQILLSPQ